MKILYITCVLFAITIGSLADDAGAKPSDKPADQQSAAVTEHTNVPSTAIPKKSEKVTTAVPETKNTNPATTPKNNPATLPPPTGTTSQANTVIPENKTDATTAKPTNATTVQTTAKPAKTTVAPANITSPVPTNATEAHPTTTALPGTTMASSPSLIPSKERHFDGLSFLGGIILTVCLIGLGLLSWKVYQNRRDGHYRTL